MLKKVLSIVLLGCSVMAGLFAKDSKKVTNKSVGTANSWNESFDINDYKDGKYNIMVTGTDNAGNESVAGPFNIYIDEESDLPVTGITNPVEMMRVTGNLNIVGTCIDDDKVTEVYIVLDGDEDNVITLPNTRPSDTYYWSSYLDTNPLFDGLHTIEVWGKDDVGGKERSGITGHRTMLTWQLDRRAPVTTILDIPSENFTGMGTQVHSKINLVGKVTDGNGIKSLEYSVDGGVHYKPVKIKMEKLKEIDEEGNTAIWTFSLPINTQDFADGPATCWFKATDNTGSVGRFAFLYFIDNTKPDVKILTPAKDETRNGVFTIAGYAKDIMGVKSLSWQWADQSGEMELIPGNPYWSVEVNSYGMNKSGDFIITAVDGMGNISTVKYPVLLDQNADKPTVKINYPAEDIIVDGTDGNLCLRGFATDDDGIKSITYKVDNGEENTVETLGAFLAQIPQVMESGTHTVTVYATDIYGIKGDAVTNSFTSKGTLPSFAKAVYKTGKETVDFTDGMELNPEADGNYEIGISSTAGLSSVSYKLDYGSSDSDSIDVPVTSGTKNATVSVPVNGNSPWGIIQLTVTAKDIYGRESKQSAILNIKDLTKVNTKTPGVYFEDSRVNEEGIALNTAEHPLTGYFAGGTAASVQLVPAVKGINPVLKGNIIVLEGTTDTDPFAVRVTTTSGAVYESKKISIRTEKKPPVLTVQDSSIEDHIPFDFSTDSQLVIKGNVESETPAKVFYNILSVKATGSSYGVVKGSEVVKATALPEDGTPVTVDARGNFTLPSFSAEDLIDSELGGIAVVEVVATNDSGKYVAKAVIVRTIPAERDSSTFTGPDIDQLTPAQLADLKKKSDPQVYWLHGVDFYGVAVYQGLTDTTFTYVKADELRADSPALKYTVTATDNPDPKKKAPSASAEIAASRSGVINARILSINDIAYQSGMIVPMERGASKDSGNVLTVAIDSDAAIDSVTWNISGEQTAGGDVTQSGTAALRTITEGSEYAADVVLYNLPARLTDISVTIKDKTGTEKVVKGTFAVVRNHDAVEDKEGLYWTASTGVSFNQNDNLYTLTKDSYLTCYANVPGTVTAALKSANDSLELTAEGNVIRIKAVKDGTYRNVGVKVTNENNGTWNSSDVAFVQDTENPELTLKTPVDMCFIQDKLTVEGSVTDINGIASLEYSIDDIIPSVVDAKTKAVVSEQIEQTFNPLTVNSNGSYSAVLDVSQNEDGYLPLTIKATDKTGKITYYNTVVFKDTTPPEVKVIVPCEGDVVNGETKIVFDVHDNGQMNTIVYTSADQKKTNKYELLSDIPELDSEATEDPYTVLRTLKNTMPNAILGTGELPIDNGMKFVFTDSIGNSTQSEWKFTVDPESDLPIAEVHLPEDNQVITTDFTISGVIYDDDGDCKLWYKIDDKDYHVIDEYASSYKINVPLKAMTDNEHTVTVYAEDIHGVKGPECTRRFRISLEEPKGAVTSPEIEKTVKGTVTIHGVASDKNGISKVQISLDNGASYNDAVGTTEWSYTFDTRVVQDDTHVVFVKIWDGYDITGLVSSIINIDNTQPDLRLELPLDDSTTSKMVFFSGQTTDNIGLTDLYITIRSLDGRTVPAELSKIDLVPEEIITQAIDLSSLSNGNYNIELTGLDAAENITRVSRNVHLNKDAQLTKVDLLYPLNGEHVQGEFNIYGTASSEDDNISKVDIYVDGSLIPGLESSTVTDSGYFKFRLKNSFTKSYDATSEVEEDAGLENVQSTSVYNLVNGEHKYVVVATTESGKTITSNEQTFIYNNVGPWVTLDSFTYGDFATNRPLIKGNAGYIITDAEVAALKAKDTPSELKAAIAGKTVKQVWLSFDNGKTYQSVSKEGKGKWQYRVENQDIAAGYHFMLIKAEMENGENAITRLLVQIDRTSPTIRLISPGEGGHFNQDLRFDGLSSDDIALKNVELTLRKGDKAAYEVPGFIQGLYFDTNVWGATLYQFGIGLTAFDGAVKVQGNFGQFTQSQRDTVSEALGLEKTAFRFGGTVIGGKIIAQLAYIPFNYFLGHDWDWLSGTVAVGANFSYFSESGATDQETGKPVAQMLSAALVQVEFPRITFSRINRFKTWAVYYEPQLWFIPSDVATEGADKYVPTFSIGLRTSVF